jgi:hypothetical protein
MKTASLNRRLPALALTAALFCTAVSLSGCDAGPLPGAPTSDLGAVNVPGKPGYTLHGYSIERQNLQPHYVYVLEKDGEPVAGTDTSYMNGKTQATTSLVLEAPAIHADRNTFHCDGLEACKEKIKKAEALASAPFHCDSVAECKTKLNNLQQAQ